MTKPLALAELLAAVDERVGTTPTAGTMAPRQNRLAPAQRCVVCRVGEWRLAIPMTQVAEVQRLPAVTPLPGLPAWLYGVANMRGEILPLLDLRPHWGLPALVPGSHTRCVVLRYAGGDAQCGLVVDDVHGLRGFEATAWQAAPLPTALTAMTQGVAIVNEHAVARLDVDRLLADPELARFRVGPHDEYVQ